MKLKSDKPSIAPKYSMYHLASMMEKDIENILEKIKHIETNPLRDDYI